MDLGIAGATQSRMSVPSKLSLRWRRLDISSHVDQIISHHSFLHIVPRNVFSVSRFGRFYSKCYYTQGLCQSLMIWHWATIKSFWGTTGVQRVSVVRGRNLENEGETEISNNNTFFYTETQRRWFYGEKNKRGSSDRVELRRGGGVKGRGGRQKHQSDTLATRLRPPLAFTFCLPLAFFLHFIF